ncbi:MAG: stage 0 sporulation family protein [Coriobacteriales bacterium]|nr:stage 0 sporulation family protein [Actinomycetes bacterium]
MPTVVGVRLRYAGKTLYFDPAGTEPGHGDHVIVETERGKEFGEVVLPPHEIAEQDVPPGLKPVVRIADESDIEKARELAASEAEAMETFRRLVNKHGLDMKPIGVETLFDESKMIFYFVAEERVDFRELVRDLASTFKSRVDMRQIGVRDEARLVGGLGHCGEQLCCVRFGGDFQPVSIRMAKEQDLPLNPLKISGLCGRLMCCLRYEYEAYKDFKQRAPRCGAPVEMPSGKGKVISLNTPRELVTIKVEDGSQMTVPLTALDCSGGSGCPCMLRQQATEVEEGRHVGGYAAEVSDGSPAAASGEAGPGGAEAKRPARRRRKRKPAGVGENAAVAPAPQVAPRTQQASAPPAAQRKRRRRRPAGGTQSSSDAG